MSLKKDQTAAQWQDYRALDGVEFDDTNGTYRTQFDCRTRLPTEAVVDAVCMAATVLPTELPPMHAVVDTDALDSLFAPTIAGVPRGRGSVMFEFGDHCVTVESDGIVTVEPAATP